MNSYFDQWNFHDDAPISLSLTDNLAEKDTFQRKFMAKRLAALLSRKAAADSDSSTASYSSFTIAICGPWGAGKTSLRNLTLDKLQENQRDCPHLSQFNPRQWNSEAAIIQAFFGELANAVDKDKNKKASKAADTLRSISTILSVGQKSAELLSVATVLTGLAPAAVPLALAAQGMGKTKELVDDAASNKNKKQEDISLAQLQAQARERMLKLKKPVVVFIDDLDRLTGPEVALVFQLLKFNADFPNVVYVLLADRVILENGLNALYPGEGARYIEKFVQLQIDLPQPTSDAIQKQFLKALEPISKELGGSIEIQAKSSYEAMFAPYLSTMRRVRLYFNALHFTLPLGKDDKSDKWEVFPFDFVLLELLRLYESDVYRRIKEGSSWLTPVFTEGCKAS